jgi:hypothetical protein
MEFLLAQHPLLTKHPEFALSVAVVDMRRVLRVRETTARGVYTEGCKGVRVKTLKAKPPNNESDQPASSATEIWLYWCAIYIFL